MYCRSLSIQQKGFGAGAGEKHGSHVGAFRRKQGREEGVEHAPGPRICAPLSGCDKQEIEYSHRLPLLTCSAVASRLAGLIAKAKAWG